MGTFYAGARRKFGARRLAAAAGHIPGGATGLPENAGASDPDLPNGGGSCAWSSMATSCGQASVTGLYGKKEQSMTTTGGPR